MYRERAHMFPKGVEGFKELLAAAEEWNKLAAEKGWAQGTLFAPTVGGLELVAEFDYPDLATYQRESEEQMMEPRAMALMERFSPFEPRSELLNTLPSFV